MPSDALSFLFGAVAQADESLTVFPDGIVFGTTSQETKDTPPDALCTLQVGWQKETIASDSSLNRLEKPPEENATAPDGESTQTTPSSTAKTFLRQYQTQLDSLHVSDADADSSPK